MYSSSCLKIITAEPQGVSTHLHIAVLHEVLHAYPTRRKDVRKQVKSQEESLYSTLWYRQVRPGQLGMLLSCTIHRFSHIDTKKSFTSQPCCCKVTFFYFKLEL